MRSTSPSPAPPIKWKFDPNPSPQAIGKACCDAVIRGWAYADGKLVYNLLDDHTVAVDAGTGKAGYGARRWTISARASL